MSVEPAALAPGASHDAGCPPDACPISMARENCLLLTCPPVPRLLCHARTAGAGWTTRESVFRVACGLRDRLARAPLCIPRRAWLASGGVARLWPTGLRGRRSLPACGEDRRR